MALAQCLYEILFVSWLDDNLKCAHNYWSTYSETSCQFTVLQHIHHNTFQQTDVNAKTKTFGCGCRMERKLKCAYTVTFRSLIWSEAGTHLHEMVLAPLRKILIYVSAEERQQGRSLKDSGASITLKTGFVYQDKSWLITSKSVSSKHYKYFRPYHT